MDLLFYGMFDTYTRFVLAHGLNLDYFLQFPAILQGLWSQVSHVFDTSLWTAEHAGNALGIIFSLGSENGESLAFSGFIVCTVVLLIALTRYYPAFISVVDGVFAGVAILGLYEGLSNVAAIYGISFLGPNSWVSILIVCVATLIGLMDTYNVNIYGYLVSRWPEVFARGLADGDEKIPGRPRPAHTGAIKYAPSLTLDAPGYKEDLFNLMRGHLGDRSSYVYIEGVNTIASRYHIDPSKVAYDEYALSRQAELTANEE